MTEAPDGPSPWQLLDHAQLGPLALLEFALRINSASLCATYPQFADPDCDAHLRADDPEPFLAENILAASDALTCLLRTYRKALELKEQRPSSQPEDHDLPF